MSLTASCLRIRSDRRWWVERLESVTLVNPSDVDRRFGHRWPDHTAVIAYLQYSRDRITRDWALDAPPVIRDIVNWCQDNCTGQWRLGETEHVYFSDHAEAMLFMVSHGKLNIDAA